MHILYVTDSMYGNRALLDPSALHRVYHYADALAASGDLVKVTHVKDVSASLVKNARHIIFHRPAFSGRFDAAMKICKKSTARLHADYDDLIFDSSIAEHSPLYLNGNISLAKVVSAFSRYHQAAVMFNRFLVSTRFLANRVKMICPDAEVTVLPNALPRLFTPPEIKPEPAGKFTVGYFPGSNSHRHDLNMIGDELVKFLGRDDNRRLVIVGRFNKDDIDNKQLRALYIPYLDYRKYLAMVSKVDVSIAPLQQNLFNDAKSSVKLIESVSVGTRIVVSRNQDMEDHQHRLSTIVDRSSDWSDALETALQQSTSTDNAGEGHPDNHFSVWKRLPILKTHLQCAA